MQGFFALLLLMELIYYCGCDFEHIKRDVTLSRKRRFLNFPEGSVAVVNLSFVKALIWNYTQPPTPTWNTISEVDINFSLPSYSMPLFGKGKLKIRRGFEGYDDQRLQLFHQIEGLMELYGLNGQDCILRTLCEAKQRLRPGKSLVEDILHVVFRISYESKDEFEAAGYREPTIEADCESLRHRCLFSLLTYLIQE